MLEEPLTNVYLHRQNTAVEMIRWAGTGKTVWLPHRYVDLVLLKKIQIVGSVVIKLHLANAASRVRGTREPPPY